MFSGFTAGKCRRTLAVALIFLFPSIPQAAFGAPATTRTLNQQAKPTEKISTLANLQSAQPGSVLVLTPKLMQSLTSLLIPKGVTVIDELRANGTLSLPGNFDNAGNFFAVSTNPHATLVSISAQNINNEQGALLSTILPSSFLSSVGTAAHNLSLNLNALSNITNAGSITSGGSMVLSAGNSIINAMPASANPLPSGRAQPMLQAVTNLNLASGTGNISNSGLISSANGDINIMPAQNGNNINIMAAGGTFQAANGAINFNNQNYSGTANINVTGGNWLSQALTFNAVAGIHR